MSRSIIASLSVILAFGAAGTPGGGSKFGLDGSTFTAEPVEIDPQGADVDVPWTVHATDALRVRSGPNRRFDVVGRLAGGDRVAGEYHLIIETDEEWLRIDLEGVDQAWISRTGVFRPHPTNLQGIEKHGNLPFGEEIVNRWWALPADYEPDDLVEIPARHTVDAEGRSYQLRREAAQMLGEMFDAAKADGITLKASSPYRSWATQKRIYDRNVGRRFNQRSSAPPGHSEHQLGTTCDISFAAGGFLRKQTPEHDWLSANAARFGWRQTYHDHNVTETGYIEEPWHWRYVGRPTADGGR